MRGLVGIALVGCTYTPPGGGGTSQDAQIDSPPIPDAPTSCPAVTKECVSPTILRVCNQIGEPAVDTDCACACPSDGGAHCAVLVPAGSGATTADLDTTGLADVVALDGTIDGNNGAIAGTTLRGSGMGVIAGIDYQQRGNNIAVFRMN